MNIAIVNSFFPPWRGGAETYVFELGRNLVKRGHSVTVLCGNEPKPAGVTLADGIIVKRLKLLTRVYGTPILPGLVGELRRSEADLFHANFPSPYNAFMVAAAARRTDTNAVLTWHNDLPPVTFGARILVEQHDRFVLPRYIHDYRRFISTSSVYVNRSRVLGKLRRKVRVVENGVDCARFNPRINGHRIRDKFSLAGRVVILFVGALTKWHRYKGLDVLLGAFKIATANYSNLALMVVGDGSLKQEYMAKAKALTPDGKVVFAGDVSDQSLPEYYASCDILAVPSRDMSEGFGLTVLEANATGKPVIASDVGGIPAVVKDGYNGTLFRPNNEAAIAQAIDRMIRHPKDFRRMGRNGRRIAEEHDWSRVAKETESVYQEALSTAA